MGPQHTFNSPHLLSTLTFPCISPYLPHTPSHFPTSPLIPLPTSPLPPPTPQHIFLLSLHHPSLSQNVVKLPCDEVSVAKLPCGEVTGNPHTPTHFPTPPSHTSSHISPSSPHTPTHFPTIPTSPLTFSKCGKVTM